MLYDNNESFTLLADKVNVRKHVEEMIGRKHLVPLIGIYNNFDEIDFSVFPKKFVVKCSHDSGSCTFVSIKKILISLMPEKK